MVYSFTSILNSNGTTAIIAPLNAGTLLDVQICQCNPGEFIDPLGDLGVIGMSIDGAEVLPNNFPLRWLVQVTNAGEFRYPDRRLSLNCWGAGSCIEVKVDSRNREVPSRYIAVFRYDTISTPLLGTPYRYHVKNNPLQQLLAIGAPGQAVDLQRETLRGAPVAAAVDWCFTQSVPDGTRINVDLLQQGKSNLQWSVFSRENEEGFGEAYASCERIKGMFDGLSVRVAGTMADAVSVPLGIVRPSLRQSLEDSLLRLPPQFGSTVSVGITIPRSISSHWPSDLDDASDSDRGGSSLDLNASVVFTSVVIERVKERNKV